jgi:hypothetical protein
MVDDKGAFAANEAQTPDAFATSGSSVKRERHDD